MPSVLAAVEELAPRGMLQDDARRTGREQQLGAARSARIAQRRLALEQDQIGSRLARAGDDRALELAGDEVVRRRVEDEAVAVPLQPAGLPGGDELRREPALAQAVEQEGRRGALAERAIGAENRHPRHRRARAPRRSRNGARRTSASGGCRAVARRDAAAAAAISGSSASSWCRPFTAPMPRRTPSRTVARIASGIRPPWKATPTISQSGRLRERRERRVERREAGDRARPPVHHLAGVPPGVAVVDHAEEAEARRTAQQPVRGLGVALGEDAGGEDERGLGHGSAVRALPAAASGPSAAGLSLAERRSSLPFSKTTSPFTQTRSMPVATACGSSVVARSATVAGSKSTRSAKAPGTSRPRSRDPDMVSGERRRLADRLLEREHPALAHVAAQHPRIRAVAPRMTAVELAVGAEIGLGPGEQLLEVALHHAGGDDVLDSLPALRLQRLGHADELDERPRRRLAALLRRSPPASCRRRTAPAGSAPRSGPPAARPRAARTRPPRDSRSCAPERARSAPRASRGRDRCRRSRRRRCARASSRSARRRGASPQSERMASFTCEICTGILASRPIATISSIAAQKSRSSLRTWLM